MSDSLSEKHSEAVRDSEERPKRGRPKKTDLVSNKRGNRGVLGRVDTRRVVELIDWRLEVWP